MKLKFIAKSLAAVGIIGCALLNVTPVMAAPADISVPKGYQLVEEGADYITVKCVSENDMGGPSLIFDRDTALFCANTINACKGDMALVGGLDGELITLYKDGRVFVVTTVGSKELVRFYKSGKVGSKKSNIAQLIGFKSRDFMSGWMRPGKGQALECGCGNKHDAGKVTFIETSYVEMNKLLEPKWHK